MDSFSQAMIYLFVSWDEGIPFAIEPVSANFINASLPQRLMGLPSKSAVALDVSLQQAWQYLEIQICHHKI